MTQKSRRQHSAQFNLDTAALVLGRGYTYAKSTENPGARSARGRAGESHIKKGLSALAVGRMEIRSLADSLSADYPIAKICEVFEVPRSSLYEARTRAGAVDPERAWLRAKVTALHAESRDNLTTTVQPQNGEQS